MRVPSVEGPELFFGLAGAVGTDLEAVSNAVARALSDVGYQTEEIRLSTLLDLIDWATVPEAPEISDETHESHIDSRMEAGDRFREVLGRGDAVAVLGILNIREIREREGGDA